MGRSVPTWRVRVDQELQALAPYRRLLPHDEQAVLDDLLPAHDPWTPLLLTALLEAWVRLRSLEDALEGRDAA